jgi:hypothetical protein
MWYVGEQDLLAYPFKCINKLPFLTDMMIVIPMFTGIANTEYS